MRLNNAVSAINDLKAILLFYPVAFVIIRSNISGILDYQLNRSALKKRKKDETVKVPPDKKTSWGKRETV